ncbi:MAG: NAD-dependent epimerase/dehydratase family protein [Pirellulaceae bacterium]
MKVLITGVCGFVGAALAEFLKSANEQLEIAGIDNLSRRGSEQNRPRLAKLGIDVRHGDLRNRSDLESLAAAEWVIDCAAEPSVLAGTDGSSSSRGVVEHNLVGTLNLLEYCRQHRAGLILLSTSRVYSIESLNAIPLQVEGDAFQLSSSADPRPPGLTSAGISESFSTRPPVSLYGATKLTSETMAMEYACAFDFPLLINRCGVIAGAGQLGRADQGIFSYWIHAYHAKRTLGYIGFGGQGYQVRDCLHPNDLGTLIDRQLRHRSATLQPVGQSQDKSSSSVPPTIVNVSGGLRSARSLRQLSSWCEKRYGEHAISSVEARALRCTLDCP